MRVALIGNTCNNNFALLRYLDMVDINADLYLYSDEGSIESNPIHNPCDDTFYISSYKHRIFSLNVPHSPLSILRLSRRGFIIAQMREFRSIFRGYDVCIGSGITPSLFRSVGLHLDIFYNHSTGIEWLEEPEHLTKCQRNSIVALFYKFITKYQKNSLRNNTKLCLCFQAHDLNVMRKHAIGARLTNVPTYYPHERLQENEYEHALQEYSLPQSLLDPSQFNVISFMRQHWVNNISSMSMAEWSLVSKRNDVLINGFYQFSLICPDNIALYLSETGKDVEASRALINDLGITRYVHWIPLLPRKIGAAMIQKSCSVGVGQLTSTPGNLWGSTTWECLAHQLPCIQSVELDQDEFYHFYNFPIPPELYNCRTIDDITSCLAHEYNKYYCKNPLNMRPQTQLSVWYENYKGLRQAGKFAELCNAIYGKKPVLE